MLQLKKPFDNLFPRRGAIVLTIFFVAMGGCKSESPEPEPAADGIRQAVEQAAGDWSDRTILAEHRVRIRLAKPFSSQTMDQIGETVARNDGILIGTDPGLTESWLVSLPTNRKQSLLRGLNEIGSVQSHGEDPPRGGLFENERLLDWPEPLPDHGADPAEPASARILLELILIAPGATP